MKVFPSEFLPMLSSSGRRLLAGRHPLCGALSRGNFVAAEGLLDPRFSRAVPTILQRALSSHLNLMERTTPSASTASTERGHEKLPKVGRIRATPDGDRVTEALREAATACGVLPMMGSKSFHGFVQALCGFPVVGPVGTQAICYSPGDYSGPHTDHLPGEPQFENGYVDVHFTFTTPGVKRQLIVYEEAGHLDQVRDIATVGGVTAYKLPFWHYTTPLEVKQPKARRWLLLATFLKG